MRESNEKSLASRLRWTLAGFVLLLVGLFFYQLLGPNPPILVSKETTYITSPLGPDGQPDYIAYINQQASDGVTPENNAAVLIWQAMGPSNLEQQHWFAMCEALGLEQVPSEQESLTAYDSEAMLDAVVSELEKRYAEATDEKPETVSSTEAETDTDESEEDYGNASFLEQQRKDVLLQRAHDALDQAMSRPWTSEQMPALARWVEQNQKPLDLLVEASTRPRYYSPSPSHLGGTSEPLIATLLPDIMTMRDCVYGLRLRAMHHLGAGRTEQAWQDLLACHRLARLTSENFTLVGQLVAIAIDGLACHGTLQLLQHEKISPEQAQVILAELNKLKPASSCLRAVDLGERLMFIDSVNQLAKGNYEFFGDFDASELQFIFKGRVNWNIALRDGNSWYDDYVTAAKLPTRSQRISEFQRLGSQLQAQQFQIGPVAVFSSLFSGSRRDEMASNKMLRLLLPATGAAFDAEDRAATQLELLRLAAALAVYRAEAGEYPEQLTDLIPGVLKSLPTDRYAEKSFLYQRKDDGGYLLYSVFENEIDDQGTGLSGDIIKGEWVDESPEDFDYAESDLVLRVPTPKFKLPNPPTKEELEGEIYGGFNYGFEDDFDDGFDDDYDEEPVEDAEPIENKNAESSLEPSL